MSKHLYTGSTSDVLILEVELNENEELRALLTKYGILLDGGFHPTSIRKEVRREGEINIIDLSLLDPRVEGEIDFVPSTSSASSSADEAKADDDALPFAQAKLFFPVKKPKIWPRHLGAAQSLDEYNANAEELLEFDDS